MQDLYNANIFISLFVEIVILGPDFIYRIVESFIMVKKI